MIVIATFVIFHKSRVCACHVSSVPHNIFWESSTTYDILGEVEKCVLTCRVDVGKTTERYNKFGRVSRSVRDEENRCWFQLCKPLQDIVLSTFIVTTPSP